MGSQRTNGDAMQSLLEAARDSGKGLPPVERWHPDYCGEMDMVIRRDGSWWHEGTRIARPTLVRLFARILRKDEDGETYLVTPAEKIRIHVEAGHFLAVRVDVMGEGRDQKLVFTTDHDETVLAGPQHPLRIAFGEDGEPEPYVGVRGRLEALLTRPVYYELASLAVDGPAPDGKSVLGVWSDGTFVPLEQA